MKIIVCIKQVPDTGEVKINPETNTLIREGVSSIINPFDMYAIEEALRLKEKYGAETFVLTMGPPQADMALREALSLGIDQAIHLSDRAFAGSDTWSTSLILSKAIEKIGAFDTFDGAKKAPLSIPSTNSGSRAMSRDNPEQTKCVEGVDLIICGKQASDGDTAQVGPGIATHINLAQATYVRKIDNINLENKIIRLERLLEEGFEILEVKLPALITVVKEINEPRLPSLRGKMRSRSQTISVWGHKDLGLKEEELGLKGSPTQVVRIFTPPPRDKGMILEGDPEVIVEKLAEELKKHLI
ncbi:MAG: electron transfer flavoprotein subunit beta/FixA family protein [Candidatus Omnitrophica bacterium]|nr:electron transfer flavoprotein subunit beta/FixA family protein [Candidatus Omnitrophota bacterium]